jgi:hypothetical protein
MLNIFINLLFAQSSKSLGNIGDPNIAIGGLGPFSNVFTYANWFTAERVSGVISKVVGVLTVAGSVWFIIQFIVGAIKWISSGGDKGNVEQAKEHLTHSVISLGILVSAYVIAGLAGAVFGIDILNPQKTITQLVP